MKSVRFALLFLIGCWTLMNAQPYTASVKHYGPEQGLSHREVNAIFQDRQGFMWFGTKFGLNRFDGHTFTTYTHDKNGLGFDDIQSIAQDADGILWLMGPFGQSKITLFNPLTGRATSFEKKFNQPDPPGFRSMKHNLVGGDDGTVYFTNFQPARLTWYHPRLGLRSVFLPQFKTLGIVRVTSRKTIWAVANDNQLVELSTEGRVLQSFSHGQNRVAPCLGQRNAGIEFYYEVVDPSEQRNGQLFSVDTSGNRRAWPLSRLYTGTQLFYRICFPLNPKGFVWNGIEIKNQASETALNLASQLLEGQVENRSFYYDNNKSIWMGTGFGIYQLKITENYFQRLFYETGTPNEKLAAIRGITVQGDTLFTNREKLGLFMSDRAGKSARRLLARDRWLFNSLNQGPDGNLFMAQGVLLVHYNPRTGQYKRLPVPDAGSVWTMCPLSEQYLLGGGMVGLFRINARTGQPLPYTQYNQFPELAHASVLHIGADRQGTRWICASTGLYTVDPLKGVTARYWSGGQGRYKLPTDSYQHYYQSPEGIFWLATANAGLIRWDRSRGQYRQFRRAEGLANDNLYAVYADRRGHLWLSSDYGIMKFDPLRFTTRSFQVEDGITHPEFNRIAHFQDKNGDIYFGGLNGITRFRPDDFAVDPQPIPRPLRIVSFRQFDSDQHTIVDKTEEVVKTGEITLPPGDRSGILEFALLNFNDAQKNVYAYQFKGIDPDWTYQTEPSLRIANVPYGEHELLIRGQVANGPLSSATLRLRVIALRPVYLRPWFLIMSAILLLTSVLGWLRWRIWSHRQEQQRLQREIGLATRRIEQDKETIAQQARVLQRLDETKSRFFANISHEFRTPLTVILGLSAELKRTNPPEWIQRFGQLTDLIERNGTNLLRLINQILDLSTIEAGQMQVQPVRTDIVRFARYQMESFHSLAADKAIQLAFRSNVDRCDVDFDQSKMQDILSNLLTNAVKFTPTGGQIELVFSTHDQWTPLSGQGYHEEVRPVSHLTGPWVQLSVWNSGPGIPTQHLPFIFDRFFRAELPTDSHAGGTGIGLALVKELVALINGGLAVQSQFGQGAEFVVSIPQTTTAPAEAPMAAQSVAMPTLISPDVMEPLADLSPDKPRLLVVEDNADVATYIFTCLQDDYQLLRAENGQAGIDLALEQVPDLILSDVMMPLRDGFDLCHTLKTDERTSHIPIALLTARAGVRDRISGLQQGADAYLVKPFEREELRVVLHNLLQSRRLLQLHYSRLALATTPPPLPATSQPLSLDDKFLHRLRSVIDERLSDSDLSIDGICQQLKMSRTTLHQKMMALTGMPVNRYVRSLRLQKARELLLAEQLNISEIAYAVGFSDPKYFSRVFSDEFGLSPAQFRQSALS